MLVQPLQNLPEVLGVLLVGVPGAVEQGDEHMPPLGVLTRELRKGLQMIQLRARGMNQYPTQQPDLGRHAK